MFLRSTCSFLAAAAALLGFGLTDAQAQSEPDDVRPILECVLPHGDGSFTAFFGYLNDNPSLVDVAVGPNNRFSPLPEDRGQTTSFEPGRSPYFPHAAFAVIWNGSGNLVWSLEGPNGVRRTSTAGSTNPNQFCPSKLPEGAACTVDLQCASGDCEAELCAAPPAAASVPATGASALAMLAAALLTIARKRRSPQAS